MIIGLSGYARSGKDEAAKVLVEQHGFTRIAFADKLRKVLYELNPIVFYRTEGLALSHYPDLWHESQIEPVRLKEVIDAHTWDGYKETKYGAEVRALLQRLGTEAGRQTLWDSIWIDAALHDLDESRNYVITDCRFTNEADAVRERGGILWRITRSGVGPANDHPSETSLDDYEGFVQYLNNDGTLEEFHGKVSRAAVRWMERSQNANSNR